MNGVQTNTMQQGGLWQIIDFKATTGSFVGPRRHRLRPGEEEVRERLGRQLDHGARPAEGTLSADKKMLTMKFGMTGPTDARRRCDVTETVTRKDTRHCRLRDVACRGADGKPMKMLEITYTKM